eukprot:m.368400 g.368400  ORF g.368400 m.368400 type:complete len:105 (-) comp56101_c0_seq2:898-1212(-)
MRLLLPSLWFQPYRLGAWEPLAILPSRQSTSFQKLDRSSQVCIPPGVTLLVLGPRSHPLLLAGETLVVDGGNWLAEPPRVPRELIGELSRGAEAGSRAMKPSKL